MGFVLKKYILPITVLVQVMTAIVFKFFVPEKPV